MRYDNDKNYICLYEPKCLDPFLPVVLSVYRLIILSRVERIPTVNYLFITNECVELLLLFFFPRLHISIIRQSVRAFGTTGRKDSVRKRRFTERNKTTGASWLDERTGGGDSAPAQYTKRLKDIAVCYWVLVFVFSIGSCAWTTSRQKIIFQYAFKF